MIEGQKGEHKSPEKSENQKEKEPTGPGDT